jgi:hypothetical protein
LHGRWGLQNKFFDDLYCFALSATLIQKQGKSIELVTDDYGAELLDGLPYFRVSLELNDIAHVDPQFWTAGKVYSLSVQTKPVLHIDGDVLFLDRMCYDACKTSWDIFVQSREMGEHHSSTYPQVISDVGKFLDVESRFSKYNFTYNTGVFGVRDFEFFKRYAFEYFGNIYKLELQEVRIPTEGDWNICLEQSLLTQMSQDYNIHVKEMINGREQESPGFFEAADEKGYAHFWGSTKYSPYWQRRIRGRLQKESPHVFASIQKKEAAFFSSGHL